LHLIYKAAENSLGQARAFYNIGRVYDDLGENQKAV